jgi:colanic acid/amylovoran biosynthesis protein
MRIFVIGQCSLHWGRMEYGNIGNYYVIEPFFKELHRVFPKATIHTTFQMTEDFCKRMDVTCVPMDWYYGFNDNDLSNAYKEYSLAQIWKETGSMPESTPYIEEVISSDLVIDFSGDMWGVNTDIAGDNRFLVGLLKDRVPQLLGKKTAMLAGSPGPFNKTSILGLAKQTFESFDLVTNREAISREVLESFGIKTDNVKDLACPAFMFEPAPHNEILPYLEGTVLEHKESPVIGFTLCGWNMLQGPFNRRDWKDEEYEYYVNIIKHIVKMYRVKVCLFSHSNGFELLPSFKLLHGRDYVMVEQLYKLLQKTEVADSVSLLTGIYLPHIIKGIISHFDMLISGRVHAAVAGLSMCVPTVIVDYGHEPKAHKLKGFAQLCDMNDYIADPHYYEDLKNKTVKCWEDRKEIRRKLRSNIPYVQSLARENFEQLKSIFNP